MMKKTTEFLSEYRKNNLSGSSVTLDFLNKEYDALGFSGEALTKLNASVGKFGA